LSFMNALTSSGVDEAPEVVRHCLSMFFTHINFQQYPLSFLGFSYVDANFSMGPHFYRI
jgi:hypothetical protein